MKTLKRMKNLINGNSRDRERERERVSERETDREIKGGSELHNQRRITNRKALPTADTPLPTFPPVYSK